MISGKRNQVETIHHGIWFGKYIQDAGITWKYKTLVVKDYTIKIDKDRWQTYKTFPVLLFTFSGDDDKWENMGQYYEKNKLSLSCAWVIKKIISAVNG